MWSIPGKCNSDGLISNEEYESVLMLIILITIRWYRYLYNVCWNNMLI